MNQPRDRYGRFLPAQDIIQEVNTLWKLAKLLPYLFFLWILLRFFRVQERFFEILTEFSCGTGCKCQCDRKKPY